MVRSVTGERFYIRAVTEQTVWQVFPTGKRSIDKRGVELPLLLERWPDFLNLFGNGRSPFRIVVPVARYFKLNSPVLIGVQESGEISIVGCPEEESGSAYTMLVADILALGARLWRMSYEQFSSMISELVGGSLEELMLERSSATWDFEVFQPVVTTNLRQGRFPVLIVADNPQGEVEEIIRYLKERNISAGLITYSLWKSDGIMIIEPVASVLTELKPVSPVSAVPPPSQTSQPVVEDSKAKVWEEERVTAPAVQVEEPVNLSPPQPEVDIPAGALPTEPAKKVAKPPSPGTKPGVMAGKRPPPKPKNSA